VLVLEGLADVEVALVTEDEANSDEEEALVTNATRDETEDEASSEEVATEENSIDILYCTVW
jgi:hypothetical protein